MPFILYRYKLRLNKFDSQHKFQVRKNVNLLGKFRQKVVFMITEISLQWKMTDCHFSDS